MYKHFIRMRAGVTSLPNREWQSSIRVVFLLGGLFAMLLYFRALLQIREWEHTHVRWIY